MTLVVSGIGTAGLGIVAKKSEHLVQLLLKLLQVGLELRGCLVTPGARKRQPCDRWRVRVGGGQ